MTQSCNRMHSRSPSGSMLWHSLAQYAPMSTTTNLSVAVKYALSRRSLLFRITAPSFMQAGADLGFISAFPTEAELLYPPGTYLRPTGRQQRFEIDEDTSFQVVDVEPTA